MISYFEAAGAMPGRTDTAKLSQNSTERGPRTAGSSLQKEDKTKHGASDTLAPPTFVIPWHAKRSVLQPMQERNKCHRSPGIGEDKVRTARADATQSRLSIRVDKVTRSEAPSISTIKPAIMKPAAVCDWNPRQHRYDLLGAANRLATAALLPTLAHGTLSLGYELDCFIQEPESRGAQAQKLTQPIRRQFTSLHGRRRCRLAGVTPLTCLHSICLCPAYQTYVRMFDRCGLIPSSAIRR